MANTPLDRLAEINPRLGPSFGRVSERFGGKNPSTFEDLQKQVRSLVSGLPDEGMKGPPPKAKPSQPAQSDKPAATPPANEGKPAPQEPVAEPVSDVDSILALSLIHI